MPYHETCTHQEIGIISAGLWKNRPQRVSVGTGFFMVACLWTVNCHAANTLAILKNEFNTLS